jgi:hypothetical protein
MTNFVTHSNLRKLFQRNQLKIDLNKFELKMERATPIKPGTRLVPDESSVDSEAYEYEVGVEPNEDFVKETNTQIQWKEYNDNWQIKRFQPNSEIILERPKNIRDYDAVNIFKAFFDESLWELFEKQTNLYLAQLKENAALYIQNHPNFRIARWSDVTISELKKVDGFKTAYSAIF